MTDSHPERDVPQVDFDVHTGDPLGDQDDTDSEDTDSGRTHTEPTSETTYPEQEQS
jgi:hypothetical protein